MKILLTGANGYIGQRLLPVLVEQEHEIYCLVRDRRRLNAPDRVLERVKIVEADLLEPLDTDTLPHEIDVAYYLVHSMSGSSSFEEKEAKTAQHFADYIATTTTQQVIYLGGIVNDKALSPHLRSRLQVEEILRSSGRPVTVLRAGIIVGSGSASFEIIRDLVEKLPVMVAPRWVNTRCQPIAIRNVIGYLEGVLLKKEAMGKTFDIGGPDILTYRQMILQFAHVRGYDRLLIPVPFLSPRLSSMWLYFVTATSFQLAKNLVDSLKAEVVCQLTGIEDIVPQELIPYEEAVRLAFDKIRQNMVLSSWTDSLTRSHLPFTLLDYVEVPRHGCLHDTREIELTRSPQEVMTNVWTIGGKRGWYFGNVLWRIRGYLDKLVGGVGLRRGRRSPFDLRSGDALDFWRVLVADKEKRRLLLYAEMKLPGDAWLEFKMEKRDHDSWVLKQTATFRPRGLWGRLYWYLLVPAHELIFGQMLYRIATYPPPTLQTPGEGSAPRSVPAPDRATTP
ncbi:Uncharacterized conserved protein YbjT, contains NAD(P)-binding and DUF2867 domains [Catalinimonas alkaloidigena]|uniref:Uncharacterized conserved protein YbjT, contains NAD(P)-binding and DUF2867 domains n=1 Tax=Catalinimonas alkaloidigena TaxID=1075417 RepID=A0A1G9K2N9_9BACT|nr:SDR family oxidoreductase [Catalinimonas alkaloidigena]SDL43493.1 Uncharacterized conserved protein YbjT, contains NAD(P)-binding and DUF2867 domains [Catalinimonas alkaloidigena]